MPITYSNHLLPNGMNLAHAKLPDSECAAVCFFMPVGSRDETGNLPSGLSHFTEHMIFKGTETCSAKELTLRIESGGGQANAYTSEDLTVYEGQGEAEQMPVLLDTLSDMVWHSTFPTAEISLERDVIEEEITMSRETPSDYIQELLAAALWPDHPLGQSIAGSCESIKKINQKTLKSFTQRHYFGSDVVIATAGPMAAEEILEKLVPLLPIARKKPLLRKESPLPNTRNIVEVRETDQLQLAMGWRTPGRGAKGRYALKLLSMILGESSSSRLFNELREERGLCYQVGTDISTFHDVGAFQVSAGLDPASRDEAIRVIHKEIHDLMENGLREGELDRAKRLILSQSKLAFEATSSHAAWVGESMSFYGKIHSPQISREAILAVSDQEVQFLARQIFAVPPAIAELREDHG